LNVIALIGFSDICLFVGYFKMAHLLCVIIYVFHLLSVNTTLSAVTIRLHVSTELFSHRQG